MDVRDTLIQVRFLVTVGHALAVYMVWQRCVSGMRLCIIVSQCFRTCLNALIFAGDLDGS